MSRQIHQDIDMILCNQPRRSPRTAPPQIPPVHSPALQTFRHRIPPARRIAVHNKMTAIKMLQQRIIQLNLHIEDATKLIPGNGVYAVKIFVNNDYTNPLKGMMNIGFRPTVDGSRRTIEVNIFDFDKDIYGEHLTVEVTAFLRTEKRFSGIDALKEQLAKDKVSAQEIL